MTTLLYTHPVFARHEVPPGHVEHPGRYEAAERALKAETFSALIRREAPLVEASDIENTHPARHRDHVETNAPSKGMAQFDADTFMGPHSLEAARPRRRRCCRCR